MHEEYVNAYSVIRNCFFVKEEEPIANRKILSGVIPRWEDEDIMWLRIPNHYLSPILFVFNENSLTVNHHDDSVVSDIVYLLTLNTTLSDNLSSIPYEQIVTTPKINYTDTVLHYLTMNTNGEYLDRKVIALTEDVKVNTGYLTAKFEWCNETYLKLLEFENRIHFLRFSNLGTGEFVVNIKDLIQHSTSWNMKKVI